MKSIGMLAVAALAGLILTAGCCDKCEKKCDKCEQAAPAKTEMKSSSDATPKASSDAHAMVMEQKICPVSGQPVKMDVSTEYKGKKVYFCCTGCIKKFDKDPETFMSKLK